MSNNQKLLVMVSAQEQDQISRVLLSWLNEFPNNPVPINYESLADDQAGMALSVIQGTYKTKQYIRGKYEARYQFKVIYRLQPGNSNNNRLKADELLDALGDWAVWRANVLGELPQLGGEKRATKLTINSRSTMFGRYENGDEDHQILMTMDYISM